MERLFLKISAEDDCNLCKHCGHKKDAHGLEVYQSMVAFPASWENQIQMSHFNELVPVSSHVLESLQQRSTRHTDTLGRRIARGISMQIEFPGATRLLLPFATNSAIAGCA